MLRALDLLLVLLSFLTPCTQSKGANYVVEFAKIDASLADSSTVKEWMPMTNHLGDSFNCSIPLVPEEDADSSKSKQKSIDVEAVLKPLETTCLFRVDGWWTYEFCWKKKLRQFHMEGKTVTMEFTLGLFDPEQSKPVVLTHQDETGPKAWNVILRSEYVNGDVCDLTSRPRHAALIFECAKDKMSSFSAFRESATCEYIVTISLPQLCADDGDSAHAKPHPIRCYPMLPDTAKDTSSPQKQGEGGEVAAVAMQEESWNEAVARDAQLTTAIPDIQYSVGTCFIHKKHKYRAVIISADPTCLQSNAWMTRMGVNQLSNGPNQPFYHAFVDERDRPNGQVTYVAQEEIEVHPMPEPIQHPLIKDVFAGFTGGHHVARGDVAVTLMPADDSMLEALPVNSDVVATVASTLIDDGEDEANDS